MAGPKAPAPDAPGGGVEPRDEPPPLTPEQVAWVQRQTLPPTENDPGNRITKWPRERAEAFLSSCPLEPVFIPLGIGEQGAPGQFVYSVIWNGWEVQVPKGQTAMVPSVIAQIITEGQQPIITKQFRERAPWDSLILGPGRSFRGVELGGKRLA